jgi:transcriptional regulator with XRE-family HTH domain
VDDRRVGWLIRRIRQHFGLRQIDLGIRSSVSQQRISAIELGNLDGVPLRTIRAVIEPMGGSVELLIRWKGGDLDRLADEAHAALVGAVARWLSAEGWQVVPEVSYSIYGERGSIDIVAWHADTRTLLVVEVKTELTSVEATLRKHDEKVRLAGRVVRERFGWEPRNIGRLLVLPDVSTARRRVGRHDAVLLQAYPRRGDAVRWWIKDPRGAFAGLRFQSLTRGAGDKRRSVTPKRIRPRKPSVQLEQSPAMDRPAGRHLGLSPITRVADMKRGPRQGYHSPGE